MKYFLRSTTEDQQTSKIHYVTPKFQQTSNKYKIKKKKYTKHKTLKSNQKNQSHPIKRKQKAKVTKKKQKQEKRQILHEKILRFPLKYQKKTLRVYCYKESDLGISRMFSRKIIPMQKDDDQNSWESLIDAQVQRCRDDLIREIKKNQQLRTMQRLSQIKQDYSNELSSMAVESRSKKSSKKKIRKPVIHKRKVKRNV